ncbi:MAG: o-succinylbenzoate synthase, partial [Flavobacteriaceae bacterium]|nr:o-succinylbenzoate synthase [Flavobacteriaceae bacterium]
MKARYKKHVLNFKQPGGTSRGILKTKETWFIIISNGAHWGIGECGLLRGLSMDDLPEYEEKLQWVCNHIDQGLPQLYAQLSAFPSIQFGLEMAFASLSAKDPFVLMPSAFTKGEARIPINGLVWMGDAAFMKQQISEKIEAGFSCIKMKIGAIDFETELSLIKGIRSQFSPSDIELRVDANGAFHPDQALEKLNRLAEYDLHSIEQPIAVRQWKAMAQLCEKSPIPIALDEELIGITSIEERLAMLQEVRPPFIILKPSFIGGFRGSDEWIEAAQSINADWWITSALESNIGLNAIAQYTYLKKNPLPQG